MTLRAPSVCAIVMVMSRLFGDLVVAQGNGGSRQHAAIEQGRVVAHRDGSRLAQDIALEDAVRGQGGRADGQPVDVVGRGAIVQGDDRVGGRVQGQRRAEDIHAGTVQGQGARDADGARIAIHAGAEGLAAEVDAAGKADVAGAAVAVRDRRLQIRHGAGQDGARLVVGKTSRLGRIDRLRRRTDVARDQGGAARIIRDRGAGQHAERCRAAQDDRIEDGRDGDGGDGQQRAARLAAGRGRDAAGAGGDAGGDARVQHAWHWQRCPTSRWRCW